MAFTRFSSQKRFVKYSECDVGEVIVEGYYKGEEEDAKYKHTIYIFDDKASGDIVVLPNNYDLKTFVEKIKPGDLCQITFKDREIMESGPFKGKPRNRLECAVDLDHRKEMWPTPGTATPVAPAAVPGKKMSITEAVENDIL